MYWCHCQSCRKHTGAPVAVFAAFRTQAYKVTKGEITKFDFTLGRTRPSAQLQQWLKANKIPVVTRKR
ncbi:MAG: GFA family protein [Candidatus Binataceae bacterium]